jgi:hypothetical protein
MRKSLAIFVLFAAWCFTANAQQTSQVQLKIDTTNRTLAVSAQETVTAEPEIGILHIGFQTQPSDAKTAYAAGAKTSNDIINALKQAGIPETSIRSESQHLESTGYKSHKFKLVQEWTVKTPQERAAEILDIAVSAGATDSGQVEWTVKDEKALEIQALDKAAARAMADAAVLARGMSVKLGTLLYVTDQLSGIRTEQRNFAALADLRVGVSSNLAPPPPLAIEPQKVSRTASVYAVYAIE